MNDKYSPEYPPRTPYVKGTLNQTRSQLMTKTAKPAQTRMFTLLIAKGYKAHDSMDIPFEALSPRAQRLVVDAEARL